MHLEEENAIELFKQNYFGELKFIRYSLSLGEANKAEESALLDYIFTFLRKFNLANVVKLKATKSIQSHVLLVTIEFSESVMVNIMVSYTQPDSFTKMFEIVGTKNLLQFNSNQDGAFYSTFIKKNFEVPIVTVDELAMNWHNLVSKSLKKLEVVTEEVK